MSIGLKHSHYWRPVRGGVAPRNYLGAQVFWFQNMPVGRKPDRRLALMLLQAQMIEDDDEEILTGII